MFDSWSASYGEYSGLVKRVVLPPRGKAGSRANKQRALMIQSALHQHQVRSGGQCKRKGKGRRCVYCSTRVKLLPPQE